MLQFWMLFITLHQVTGHLHTPDTCDTNNTLYVNGCTMPLDLDIWYTDHFEIACNIHDICYFCGHGYNKSRHDCDSKFLEDMNSVCLERMTYWELPLCVLFSTSFYLIVRAISESYFMYEPPGHCSAEWVKHCITP